MMIAFNELYSKMSQSKNINAMRIFGDTMRAMMEDLIKYKPETAQEYLDVLEAINWYNYLSKKEACFIIKAMTPKGGWDISDWEKYLNDLELNNTDAPYYNKWALYTTMNMIYSDSANTLIKIMKNSTEEVSKEDLFKAIYLLSLDKLRDEDGVFNIRSYFNL